MIRTVLLAAAFAAATGAASAGGWQPMDGDPGSLRAFSDASDQPWYVTLRCEPHKAFTMTLVASHPTYSHRVSFVLAKTAGEKTTRLWPDQDRWMPGMIQLKGADAIERDLLARETLSLKISVDGDTDSVATFTFKGIGARTADVLATCPPF